MTAGLHAGARGAMPHGHVITWTVDQRRGFLLELADHVNNERGWVHKPFTLAVPSIVPAVAAEVCKDPIQAFEYLVEVFRERALFLADEVGYAAERDLPVRAEDLSRLHDRLESEVDDAVRYLLGAKS